MESDDRLPGQICKKCVTNLVALYKFKKCVNENEKKLQQILSNLKDSTKKDSSFVREPQNDYVQAVDLKTDTEFVKINSADESSETEDIIVDEPVAEIKYETAQKVEAKTESNERDNKHHSELSSKSSQCEICGKILSCHSNLVLHKRRHTGEKPFACDLCEKRFARTEHLNIHRRIHTGKKFLLCCAI